MILLYLTKGLMSLNPNPESEICPWLLDDGSRLVLYYKFGQTKSIEIYTGCRYRKQNISVPTLPVKVHCQQSIPKFNLFNCDFLAHVFIDRNRSYDNAHDIPASWSPAADIISQTEPPIGEQSVTHFVLPTDETGRLSDLEKSALTYNLLYFKNIGNCSLIFHWQYHWPTNSLLLLCIIMIGHEFRSQVGHIFNFYTPLYYTIRFSAIVKLEYLLFIRNLSIAAWYTIDLI